MKLANLTQIKANGVIFSFSYTTLIVVMDKQGNLFTSKNYWTTSTGKHLNFIDGGDKKIRLEKEAFNNAIEKIMLSAKIEQVPELL